MVYAFRYGFVLVDLDQAKGDGMTIEKAGEVAGTFSGGVAKH